ncbi:hypothetical protein SAMN05444746_109222 [Variovorax sp. OK212]|nr:hypothetical protein SAMN05518853_109222 [Variovorax sp. OK202]SFD68575.1 hypothetical protein SAMN05444746_109222 [Variovorax sp. OK212]
MQNAWYASGQVIVMLISSQWAVVPREFHRRLYLPNDALRLRRAAECVEALRRQRWLPRRIAMQAGRSPATLSCGMKRARLPWLEAPESLGP